ncbi:hypothetical protein [Oceanicola sp. S124]|uniref:hypothetical protein n=1 Tax=Oceanicola sp. S124 TaxID=1042378 RepID=UPI0002558D71|nr:hypothetical protein [Oceanicola sp. S124]
MRSHALLIALLLGLPLAAPAQDSRQTGPDGAQTVPGNALSAQEFDAYSLGKTFYYGAEGQAYGVEEYLPGRRVRWSFLDGNCKDGHWYEEAGHICFVYEDQPDPQCWSFVEGGNGLTAYFQGGEETVLYEMQSSAEPMQCKGPEVGV